MLNEVKLYAPVRDWLVAQGYRVWPECFDIDVVGINANRQIVAVELKMSLTKGVLRQASRNAYWAHKSWAAVPTTPRSLDMAKQVQIGVLTVSAGGVGVLLEPSHPAPWNGYPHRLDAMMSWPDAGPDDVGGVPQLAGIGPRISARKAVADFLKLNPGAGWREIYRGVVNHYSSHASMRGALGGSQFLESLRKPQLNALEDLMAWADGGAH